MIIFMMGERMEFLPFPLSSLLLKYPSLHSARTPVSFFFVFLGLNSMSYDYNTFYFLSSRPFFFPLNPNLLCECGVQQGKEKMKRETTKCRMTFRTHTSLSYRLIDRFYNSFLPLLIFLSRKKEKEKKNIKGNLTFSR